jgi:hypothetical protein
MALREYASLEHRQAVRVRATECARAGGRIVLAARPWR